MDEVHDKLTGDPRQPTLPLLRLRVEYTDEMHLLTPGRFGNNFHGRVANPSEILLFRKKVLDRSQVDGDGKFAASHMDELKAREIAGTSMEDLILQYFNTTTDDRSQLKLLGIRGIAQAVSNYIEKDDKDAVAIIVDKQLNKTLKALKEREDEDGDGDELITSGDPEADIDDRLGAYKKQRQGVNEAEEAKEMLNSNSARNGGGRKTTNYFAGLDNDVDDDFDATPVSEPAKRGRGRGGRAARGGRGSRGGSRGKAAVASTSSIQSAFSRQSQRQAAASAANNGHSPAASRRSGRTKAASGSSRSSKMYVEDTDSD